MILNILFKEREHELRHCCIGSSCLVEVTIFEKKYLSFFWRQVMKNQKYIMLLTSISIFLIIMVQDLQRWGEYSAFRQSVIGTLIVLWFVHFVIMLKILYSRKNISHKKT